MMTIYDLYRIYLYGRGNDTWVCFRYDGRIYNRKCEYRMGMYHFKFRGKYFSCFGQKQYEEV